MAPRIDIDAVRHAVSLAMILAHYRLDGGLKRVGSQVAGCCPIHRGTNPRQFVVDLKQGLWRCFGGCDRGGGSLELVAEMEGLDVRGAAHRVAQWFAIAGAETTARDEAPSKRRPRMSGKPSHKVYVVEDRGRDDDQGDDEQSGFWTRIGSAWPHKDGKGLNIVLAALPVNGRLVLREYTEKDATADQEKETKRKRK